MEYARLFTDDHSMNIFINGQPADITLESERTIGELLSGVEDWLRRSGFRLHGLEIDGESINSASVSDVFNRELNGIQSINILACSQTELMADALMESKGYVEAFSAAPYQGKSEIQENWKNSAAHSFLQAENQELYRILDGYLNQEPNPGEDATGIAALNNGIVSLVNERIREIEDPQGEFVRSEAIVLEITKRLEELPLDIQIGKDGRAAETISLFSTITDKLLRLIYLLQSQSEDGIKSIVIDSIPVYHFLEEFCTALKELLAAYESRDVVLVGDLAEYELAPRLRSFYSAIKSSILSFAEKI